MPTRDSFVMDALSTKLLNDGNTNTDTNDGGPLLGLVEPHGMSWVSASFTMAVIILGLGILGISWAISTLGWVLGIFLLLLSGVGAVYSGIWIHKIVDHITDVDEYPRRYQDLGMAAYGEFGRQLVQAVQYTFLSGALVAVQYTASQSLQQVVHASGGSLCIVNSNVIIAVAMIPLMQFKQLKETPIVAVLGIICIIIPVSLYLSEIREDDSVPASVGFPKSSSFDEAVNGITTLVFAFQGQTIFPEIIAEMKHRDKFPKAVVSSVIFMTFIYVIVGAYGYYWLGGTSEYLEDYVDDLDSKDDRTTAGNAMLVLHVMAGYTINGNVMNTALARKFCSDPTSKLQWFIVTICVLTASFVLSNVIPSLSDLLSVLGATCGYALTFMFPAVFSLKLLRGKMTQREVAMHWTVLFLAAAATGIGCYATMKKLVENLEDSVKTPLTC